MSKVILITGSSSGIGKLSAYALADAGHTVYASMRSLHDSAEEVAAARAYAAEHGVTLRPIELDVLSQASADAAIASIIEEAGRLDVLVQNAGHMVFGPAEAFTPEQYAQLYDVNVIGAQRVNRAALPHMRALGEALIVWVSSSSARGGTPPLLGPYFAAKAAMDSLAVTYAGELVPWGVETTIVVPGVFTGGSNHFRDSGSPADESRASEYARGPCQGLAELVRNGHQFVTPKDADITEVARAIVRVVATPFGRRPFRVTIDPANGGAEVVNMMSDRCREEYFRRTGLQDFLSLNARAST